MEDREWFSKIRLIFALWLSELGHFLKILFLLLIENFLFKRLTLGIETLGNFIDKHTVHTIHTGKWIFTFKTLMINFKALGFIILDTRSDMLLTCLDTS